MADVAAFSAPTPSAPPPTSETPEKEKPAGDLLDYCRDGDLKLSLPYYLGVEADLAEGKVGNLNIWHALEKGDLAKVVTLVLGGVSLETSDIHGAGLLHHAAASANPQVIKFLVRQGCSPNTAVGGAGSDTTAIPPPTHPLPKTIMGETPLMWAARCSADPLSRMSAIDALVKLGADVNARDAWGRPAAAHALASPVVLHKLRCLGTKMDVKGVNDFTLLHWAALEGSWRGIQYLVEECNLEVDAVDSSGMTPLDHAKRCGHRDAQLLLENKSGIGDTRRFPVDSGNSRNLLGRGKLATTVATFFLPNLVLLAASQLPPIAGVAALAINLYFMNYITRRGMKSRDPDPGLAGWYSGALFFGSCVLVTHVFPVYHNQTVKGAFWVVTGLMFYCYLRAVFADPGMIFSSPSDRSEIYRKISQNEPINSQQYDLTSLIVKPTRSKFCSTTKKPVARFDHYCVWTCNAIGAGNHRPFFFFTLFQVISQSFVFWTTYQYFRSAPPPKSNSPCDIFDFFFSHGAATYFLVIYNFAVFLFIISVFTTQVWYISRNVTSNEVWFSERYSWCIKLGTRVYTLYDRGFIANWKEFLFGDLQRADRCVPTMGEHLSKKVKAWHLFKVKQARRYGLPDPTPEFIRRGLIDGRSYIPPPDQTSFPAHPPQPSTGGPPREKPDLTVVKDEDTGLMLPQALRGFFENLPREKKLQLASLQSQQLQQAGMIGEDGMLRMPPEEKQEQVNEQLQSIQKQLKARLGMDVPPVVLNQPGGSCCSSSGSCSTSVSSAVPQSSSSTLNARASSGCQQRGRSQPSVPALD